MQRKLNFLSFFLIFNIAFWLTSKAELTSADIKEGTDSLFDVKNFTDAKLLYDDLYFKQNVYSDDIVIKLAYINEGLEKIGWTMYFLEKYLQSYPKDEKTKEKINSLAEKYKLSGYNQSDLSEIIRFISSYKKGIIISLVTILCLLFIFHFLRKSLKNNITPIIILSIVVLIVNFGIENMENVKYGIITENALLFDHPGAGGSLVKKVKPGDKVQILNSEDIWHHIIHDDNECYIKANKITQL